MIEAFLSKDLFERDEKQAEICRKVHAALDKIDLPLKFEQTIEAIVKETGENQADVEEAFWQWMEQGMVSISPNFYVLKN